MAAPERELFMIEVARGNVDGYDTVHKFGRNKTVSTSLVPLTSAGVFQTPTSATALELISSSADDTAAGTGARSITIEGLDGEGNKQVETYATNGDITAASAGSWLRVFRMYVATSGVYGSATQSSHAGTITLRASGGGATWAEINVENSFGLGQSLIGVYTVPKGKEAYLMSIDMSVDSTRAANIYFFKRENILQTSAPFTPLRVQNVYSGVENTNYLAHLTNEKFDELTDLGFMGIRAGNNDCDITVEFELLIIDK